MNSASAERRFVGALFRYTRSTYNGDNVMSYIGCVLLAPIAGQPAGTNVAVITIDLSSGNICICDPDWNVLGEDTARLCLAEQETSMTPITRTEFLQSLYRHCACEEALVWYNEHPHMSPENWYAHHMPPWWQLWLLLQLIGDEVYLGEYRPPQRLNYYNGRLYPWDRIDPALIERYRAKIVRDFPWSTIAVGIRKDGRHR